MGCGAPAVLSELVPGPWSLLRSEETPLFIFLFYYFVSSLCCGGYPPKMGETAIVYIYPSNRTRNISSNAVSFFLRQVIREGDGTSDSTGPGPRAHSIRGASTSLAYKKNWSCSEVMSAATWKSNTVFTSFYLNEVAFELDEVRSLGPFVAANQPINV